MKLFFLLILLTRNDAGDINASFVNTETLAQCEQKMLLVKGIFTSVNIPVVANRCIESPLRFSEFAHASSAKQTRHFYLIGMHEEGVDIKAVADWRSCRQGANVAGALCSSSVQKLLK